MKSIQAVLAAVLAVTATPRAGSPQILSVQSGRIPAPGANSFGVRTMDFDLWCQQTQRYPSERCSARRPEDVRAFEAYRASVERYELEYLKQIQRNEQARSRTNRDPSQTVTGKQDGVP